MQAWKRYAGISMLVGIGCTNTYNEYAKIVEHTDESNYSFDDLLEEITTKEKVFTSEERKQLEKYFLDIRGGEEGKKYIKDIHDCDDMAQELRDILRNVFCVPYTSLRLRGGKSRKSGERHLWLEVREKGEWWIYDPSQNRLREPRSLMLMHYKMDLRLKGDHVFRDEGYSSHGDYFENGQWISRTK